MTLTSHPQIALILFIALQNFGPAFSAYDRCDDLCRVLGHTGGGSCEGTTNPRCICYPDHVDVEEFLPSICETQEKEHLSKKE